jgi:hypothetical protein
MSLRAGLKCQSQQGHAPRNAVRVHGPDGKRNFTFDIALAAKSVSNIP